MIKAFILFLTVLSLFSCIPKNTSNKRSPCAAIGSDNPYAINPCVKRSANSNKIV